MSKLFMVLSSLSVICSAFVYDDLNVLMGALLGGIVCALWALYWQKEEE